MSLNSTLISFGTEYLDVVLLVGIPFGLILGFLNVLGSAGIIWHEQFGSDHKRIFLNKMVTALNWVSIVWFLLIQPSDMLLYLYKPLPDWFCKINYILRNMLVLLCLIYTDLILIIKYAFIFWMKNPANFQDDFWSFVINVWVVTFRYMFYSRLL